MLVEIILFINLVASGRCARTPTRFLVTRAGPCYETQESIVKVSEFDVTTQMYDSKLSGVINIYDNITNGWKIKATIRRCADIRNVDSCYFSKSFFMVKNACEAVDDERNIYATFFNFTKPKIKCPVQAGRYKLQNYPWHSNNNHNKVLKSKISASVFGYMLQLEGYTFGQQKEIVCVVVHLQLLYMRNHEWLRKADHPADTNS